MPQDNSSNQMVMMDNKGITAPGTESKSLDDTMKISLKWVENVTSSLSFKPCIDQARKSFAGMKSRSDMVKELKAVVDKMLTCKKSDFGNYFASFLAIQQVAKSREWALDRK